MLCFKNIIMIFILLSEYFVDKHKRKQKGIFAQNWQGLKMCYVRCKWSREVESCKKQTTVYRRRVRHSHFNFSQMMMMMMIILGQMSFIPPPIHPTQPLHPYLRICICSQKMEFTPSGHHIASSSSSSPSSIHYLIFCPRLVALVAGWLVLPSCWSWVVVPTSPSRP